ncbi:MAG: PHD/YefM family antitoxin component YafN of YafNO toxin-antitoxin module [Patescibacteria group bacterium]|jgi:PHD/YefM family antitoxin component YafN of YafNO toxin-antitoxin module
MIQEQEIKNEIASLKETCEILSNTKILKSIKRSLEQIESGKEMPLSSL